MGTMMGVSDWLPLRDKADAADSDPLLRQPQEVRARTAAHLEEAHARRADALLCAGAQVVRDGPDHGFRRRGVVRLPRNLLREGLFSHLLRDVVGHGAPLSPRAHASGLRNAYSVYLVLGSWSRAHAVTLNPAREASSISDAALKTWG